MIEQEKLEEKIKQYELFIEDTLKKDLKEVQDILDKRVNQHKEWEEVKLMINVLKEFKEKDDDMNIRVELGCGVHAYGEVSSYEDVFIDIGLGCLLPMNYEEAEKYADIRLRSLKKDIDHHRDLAVQIKVYIKTVLLAINELQATFLSDSMTKTMR